MPSDSMQNDSSQWSSDSEESGEVEVLTGELDPYQDEPLTSDSETDGGEQNEEADMDGLTPTVLEARFEQRVTVREWFVNGWFFLLIMGPVIALRIFLPLQQ